jgi:tetratricopeptide (TPR) repeat protein
MAEQAFARGARAAEQSDLQGAQEAFAQVLREMPDSASLHARIGLAYMESGPPQPAPALPHLRRALELDADQPFPVYLDAIMASAKLGRETDGRQLLRQAGRLFRDNALALNYIGYLLVDDNTLTAEALPLLERAVSLEPQNGIIIDSLGWAHYRLDHLSRAAALLEQASKLAPDNAEIQNHLGIVYADLGRIKEAGARFRRALKINPRFDSARAALRALQGT